METALITGASAGIGKVFAEKLALGGAHRLLITARRLERLEALAAELRSDYGAEVEVFAADVSSEKDVERLAAWARGFAPALSLLVNNAGFGSYGEFIDRPLPRELEMLRVNCAAPLQLISAFAGGMKAAGRGAIINVCSTAAFQPVPMMATYAATKAFLMSFSLSLGEELRGSGVDVLALCPGPTESEFHIAAGLPHKIEILPAMKAEDVVDEALSALRRHKRLVVNGRANRALALISRKLPLTWAAPVAMHMLKRCTPLGK